MELFCAYLMVISGIAGIVTLLFGLIGPGLALLVIALVCFFIGGRSP